jgi:hypothetical protein
MDENMVRRKKMEFDLNLVVVVEIVIIVVAEVFLVDLKMKNDQKNYQKLLELLK